MGHADTGIELTSMNDGHVLLDAGRIEVIQPLPSGMVRVVMKSGWQLTVRETYAEVKEMRRLVLDRRFGALHRGDEAFG